MLLPVKNLQGCRDCCNHFAISVPKDEYDTRKKERGIILFFQFNVEFFSVGSLLTSKILLWEDTAVGPFQLAIHVIQNRRAGEQKLHWDKTNEENYHFKLCMYFVCLVPVRLLLSSVAVLYHVNG